MTVRRWMVVSVLLCLAGCSGVPRAGTVLEPTLKIVIAPPTIEYRDIESDGSLPIPAADRERVVSSLWAQLEAALRTKGLTARRMTPEESKQLHLDGMAGGLFEVVRARNRGVAPAIQASRAQLRDAFPKEAVLAVRCRSYRGPGFFMIPLLSPMMMPNSSRLVLDGQLLNLREERTLWQHAVQMRRTSDTDEDDLQDLVQELLGTVQSTTQR